MTAGMRAAVIVSVATFLFVRAAGAQDTVGSLRIVDESGLTIGQEAAPAGEKLYRLPAGTTAFRVAMDFEGSAATEVELRVMGPSGTVLHQSSQTLSEPGTATFDIESDAQPFAEQEYVVNAYVGTEGYLADSLQLVVGAAQLPTPEEQAGAGTGSGSLDPLSASAGASGGSLTGSDRATAEVPGGPPRTVLALAVLGIIVLFGIVLWAGWSATRRA